MENVKKVLKAGLLEFTLTEEKLFIKGPTGQESFALRSLNGIGIYDDVDKHKAELDKYNKSSDPRKSMNMFGGIMLIGGIFLMMKNGASGSFFAIIGGVILWSATKYVVPDAPKLESEVRIMLSGGSREFKFFKEDSNSVEVAEFIALVEETLTAYNK